MTDAFHDEARAILATFNQQPQRQDGTSDQLADLEPFARRLGVPVPSSVDLGAPAALSPRLAALLEQLPSLPPRTDWTAEQALRMLRAMANRLGFYDAADLLRARLESSRRQSA